MSYYELGAAALSTRKTVTSLRTPVAVSTAERPVLRTREPAKPAIVMPRKPAVSANILGTRIAPQPAKRPASPTLRPRTPGIRTAPAPGGGTAAQAPAPVVIDSAGTALPLPSEKPRSGAPCPAGQTWSRATASCVPSGSPSGVSPEVPDEMLEEINYEDAPPSTTKKLNWPLIGAAAAVVGLFLYTRKG